MNRTYFSLPLNSKNIVSNKEHATCSIKESIANFLHLLTTTYFGECTFDDSFGCNIWEIDFDNLTNVNKVKNIISDSLYDTIKKHEKRLSNVAIEVVLKQKMVAGNSHSIKKRVYLKLSGKVKKTNEDFLFQDNFFIGPLSYY